MPKTKHIVFTHIHFWFKNIEKELKRHEEPINRKIPKPIRDSDAIG